MVYCSLYQSSSSLSIRAPFAVVFMHFSHVWSSNLYVLLSLLAVLIVSMLLNLLTHQKNENKKEACCLLFKELPSVFDISAIRGPSTEQLESFLGFLNNNYRVSWYKAVL